MPTNPLLPLIVSQNVSVWKAVKNNVPVIVLGELYYGASNSGNPVKHYHQIGEFLELCNIIEITKEISYEYGQLKTKLKQQGTPIPENDIWIGATSKEQKIKLLTRDKHFEKLKEDITVV